MEKTTSSGLELSFKPPLGLNIMLEYQPRSLTGAASSKLLSSGSEFQTQPGRQISALKTMELRLKFSTQSSFQQANANSYEPYRVSR